MNKKNGKTRIREVRINDNPRLKLERDYLHYMVNILFAELMRVYAGVRGGGNDA